MLNDFSAGTRPSTILLWVLLASASASLQTAAQPLSPSDSRDSEEPGPWARSELREAVSVAGTPGTTPAETAIRVTGSRVSVMLRSASLVDVLASLADRQGFGLRVDPKAGDRRIDDAFEDLPLWLALRRLLHGSDYVMLFEAGAGPNIVRSIRLISANASAAHAPTSAQSQPIDEIDPRLLLRSIEPSALPPGIREDLAAQIEPPDPALTDEIQARRDELLDRLLRRLEARIGPGSETLQGLRSQLLPGPASSPEAEWR
jgi:hypothetical protein